MSFPAAGRPANVGIKYWRPVLAVIVLALVAAALVSCSNAKLPATGTGNTAYVTLPSRGSILTLHIDGANGAVKVIASTPIVAGNTPQGLVLSPSNKLLYVANSLANTISTFSVGSDGSLSLAGTTSTGPANVTGPWETIIDPSGKYLLVTNTSGYVSVFTIDSSGALAPAAGSPFYANESPTEIVMPPSENLVYVSNSGSTYGTVTAFAFDPTLASCGAILCKVPGSPFLAGAGASGLAVDSTGQFLYVANSSAINDPQQTTAVGNISAFSINITTGVLTQVAGSPFFPPFSGSYGPSALAVIPNSQFLYATTPGSSYSVWCFTIDTETGQLAVTANAPFSVPSGGLFDVIDTNGGFLFSGTTDSNGSIAASTYDPNSGQPTPVLYSPFALNAGIPGKMVIVP